MIKIIKELYEYREMINTLVHKELRGKYKGSVLGFFWSLLTPLLQLVVYTIVFSVFMRAGIENFAMFLFVALIPWLFFNNCVAMGSMSIVHEKNLVSKIYFPRMVLPVASVVSYFINMLLCFIIVFAALIITGIGVAPTVLWYLPIIMIIEFVMGLGAALFFSALTVFFRDLEYILNIVCMAWMYMTPILYPVDMVPEKIQQLLYFNPMTSVVIAYRDILFYHQAPQMQTLIYAVGFGVAIFVVGIIVFQKLQKNFVEEL